jgi:hypothetical protein
LQYQKVKAMDIKKDVAVSDSGFVFNPTTGESYSVNPIGMEIIKLMKEGKSMEEINRVILAHYNVEETTVEKDLHDFMEMLSHYALKEENGTA